VTLLVAWVIAVPLGIVARSLIRGGPWGRGLLIFGGIAMGFTLLFLIGGRLLLLLGALARRSGREARRLCERSVADGRSRAGMSGGRVAVPEPAGAQGFWLEEAIEHDPGAPCPPLRGRVAADVCIVGGGFAGLWTAVELTAREPSLRVALLESGICGGGASGRNGGFFSSSWHDLPGLCGLFGEDEGARYALALAEEVEAAERWCGSRGWTRGSVEMACSACGPERGRKGSPLAR